MYMPCCPENIPSFFILIVINVQAYLKYQLNYFHKLFVSVYEELQLNIRAFRAGLTNHSLSGQLFQQQQDKQQIGHKLRCKISSLTCHGTLLPSPGLC